LPSQALPALRQGFAGEQAVTGSATLLVAVVGPTGSGKTALSLALGERFSGEIVSCDSVAMYREFEIGTAKPTPAERARVPHHVLDCVDPGTSITAGEYARQARAALEAIRSRGHLPIVVGGTGLYFRALIDGLFPGPERSEVLRQRLRGLGEGKGSVYLHRLLGRLDRRAAVNIHRHDTAKIIRALEVCLSSRRPMSMLWEQGRNPLEGFRVFRLGLSPPRGALYERINQRAVRMFSLGLLEETSRLLRRYGDAALPLKAIGYKQAAQAIRHEISAAAALVATQQAHRNYAKRQVTWFRREPELRELEGFGDDPSIQKAAIELVEARMAEAKSGD
jgi:tRNA dimethylallyltransferase